MPSSTNTIALCVAVDATTRFERESNCYSEYTTSIDVYSIAFGFAHQKSYFKSKYCSILATNYMHPRRW